MAAQNRTEATKAARPRERNPKKPGEPARGRRRGKQTYPPSKEEVGDKG